MLRPLLIAALVCHAVAFAAADPPSPRLAALAAKPSTQAAFWNQVEAEGTPIVEDVKDPKGRLLVTFVHRATSGLKAVAVYNVPNGRFAGYQPLTRIPKTDVFAWSVLLPPTSRFSYMVAPGDDFGPPQGMDFEKRQALFRPNRLNKRLYVGTSLVELPKAPAQPWLVPRRGTPTGDLVAFTAKSKSMGNERLVMVYTPPMFAKTGPRYPLVVMFDQSATLDRLLVTITLDELIAAKQIPPVVVLLVGSNADRGKELPGNPAFADLVALDLVPWVRRTYHASTDPRTTIVAGISYGGIAATFAAVRHPAVYGNVLSQSGSYWWAPDDEDPEAHARMLAGRAKLPLRFWLECGLFETGAPRPSTDQLGANRHMREVLRAREYEVSYREFAGAHEYLNWRGSIADGLIALLATPPKATGKPPASPGKAGGVELVPAPRPTMGLATRIALLDGGAAAVARLKQLSAEHDVTEPTVNETGYALLGIERARDALPLLQWNVERFPRSANAHDSLAEAYYIAGDRVRARASYQRSLSLDPKNPNAKKMVAFLK